MLSLSALRAALAGYLAPQATITADLSGSSVALPRPPAPSSSTAPTPERAPIRPRAPARPYRVAMRPVIAQATALWLATRVAYALFTYFAVMFAHATSAGEFLPLPPRALLAAWDQWDGQWYIHIAQAGYFTPQATAFFPLYPALIKAMSILIGPHWLLAAMLVSNLGTLGAFIGVGLLAAHEARSRAAAVRTLRVFVAYPLAFFLVAPYTEGLFVACVAFAFFNARRGAWVWAAVCAFLAGLTRPTGAVLIPVLLWEFGRQQGWWRLVGARLRQGWPRRWWPEDRARLAAWWAACPWRQMAWWRGGAWRKDTRLRALGALALLVGAVPFAILLYMSYLELRFGHPLLWLHVQQIYWRRDGMPIFSAVKDAIAQVFDMPPWTYWQARQLVDLAPVVAFGLITLVSLRRLPFAFTIYMVGLLYVAVSTPVIDSPDPDLLISAGRFMLTAVPIFLILGQWTRRRPWADLLLVGGGFLIQAVLAAFFLQAGWLI